MQHTGLFWTLMWKHSTRLPFLLKLPLSPSPWLLDKKNVKDSLEWLLPLKLLTKPTTTIYKLCLCVSYTNGWMNGCCMARWLCVYIKKIFMHSTTIYVQFTLRMSYFCISLILLPSDLRNWLLVGDLLKLQTTKSNTYLLLSWVKT